MGGPVIRGLRDNPRRWKVQNVNKSEVYAAFDIDEYGTIRTLGKFEGESWIAPIVYGWWGDGDRGEEVTHCECEEVEGEGEGWIDCECPTTNIYALDPESRAILELDDQPEAYAVTLDESDQGFVYVGTLTRAEYDQAVS